MLKVAMGNGNTSKGPKVDFEPDRTGSFFGLSMSGFHPVAYTDWGAANTRIPVVCVHGLSRQGRDFDYLAAHLAGAGRRVVCPDLVGRGQSGRLRDPNEYALPQYCADMNALIAALDAGQVDWVGTSLGGLIGIVLAGLPGNPIRRLVINDIAPYLPWAGLARIGSYISAMPVDFHDLGEAEAYFREVLAPFGSLSDEQWCHVTRHSVAWHASRERYVMLFDPQIVRAFHGTTALISGNTGPASRCRSLHFAVWNPTCCRRTSRTRWSGGTRGHACMISRAVAMHPRL